MAFEGYLELGGVEIINAERTEAYIRHQKPSFPLSPSRSSAEVHVAVEDEPYESPLVDDAPWVNPSDEATHGFFGMYPLSIEGIGDSTHSATVTEGILSGATTGTPRDGSRTIRIKGALIGADELSANAGLAWLKAAVRADNCGMHTTCSSSDLRYFLAAPQVCLPLYGREITSSQSFKRGGLTPGTSPSIYNLEELDEPASVAWTYPFKDGTVIEWGLLPRVGTKPLTRSAPTIVRRTNYVPNSSFTLGVDLWETENTSMEWMIGDGASGTGNYAHVSGGGDVTTRTNWAMDPAFKLNPATSGWRSSGTMTNYNDATSPVENSTAVFDFTNVVLSSPASVAPGYGEDEYGIGSYQGEEDLIASTPPNWNEGGYGEGVYPGAVSADPTPVPGAGPTSRWAEFTYSGPVARTSTVVSFYVAQQIEPVTITVTGSDNTVIAQQSVSVTETPFQRVSFTLPLARFDTVRLSTPAVRLRLAGMLIETGTVLRGWFYGSSPDDSASSIEYSWLGTPNNSASRLIIGDRSTSQISTPPMDTPYGPLTASFSARAALGAQITAQIVSTFDGSVLSEESFVATSNWERFSLNTMYGRATALVITSIGDYDLDQVLVEPSEVLWSFFTGDSAPVADYKTEWVGTPHRSPSRMTFIGSTLLTNDDSRVRPYITVLRGSLEAITLTVNHREKISLEAQLEPYERRYHEVSCTGGPTIIREYRMERGHVIEVELFVTADDPFAYSNSTPIAIPVAPTTALYTDAVCPVISPTALIDPDVPLIPLAPRPPAVPAIGIDELSNWRRYWVDVPKEKVSAWSATVPTLELTTKDQAIRQLRVRFHANPFGFAMTEVDPCSYCAEFIVSYLPPNTTLTLNGMSEKALAAVAGAEPVPADHLLYGTGGTPMTWPELSCSNDYVMTIDIPPTAAFSNLDIDLVVNRKE